MHRRIISDGGLRRSFYFKLIFYREKSYIIIDDLVQYGELGTSPKWCGKDRFGI